MSNRREVWFLYRGVLTDEIGEQMIPQGSLFHSVEEAQKFCDSRDIEVRVVAGKRVGDEIVKLQDALDHTARCYAQNGLHMNDQEFRLAKRSLIGGSHVVMANVQDRFGVCDKVRVIQLRYKGGIPQGKALSNGRWYRVLSLEY